MNLSMKMMQCGALLGGALLLFGACAGETEPSGSQTQPCPAGIVCGGVCLNHQSDPNNCGACGNSCGGLFCSQGQCTSECAVGETACGQACENLQTSFTNCGSCGNVCASGVCNNGVCQEPISGSGGAQGTGGGDPGTGGGNPGSGGGSSSGDLGGYHTHGDWAGFAFTFADGGATITPESFEDMLNQDGPYCVKGTVQATADYTSIAAVGVNVSQPKIEDAPVNIIDASGEGLLIDFTVNSGADGIRVQIEDGTDPSAPDAADHRWCVNFMGSQTNPPVVIPWESFNTECWTGGDGKDFDPTKDKIAKVILYVPDAGSKDGGTAQNFDFCLNDIGPANVQGRGTGEIVDSCGNNVSWTTTSTGDQYANIATSNNRYRYQNNGWGWQGGSHSVSLLPGAGYQLTTQTCSRSDAVPCSFPSVYIGTSADNNRTEGNGLPKQISSINSVPTCLGWSSGSAGARDEYNVSYDVWFASNSGASYADEFLMVWLRKPPTFQPAGEIVVNGVVIGDQTWTVSFGPNHDGDNVVSYVAPNDRADGKAYSFDLKDFIDDALARGYLTPSYHLISVMGGTEIWGGGQGASITGFRAEVQ